MLKEIPSFLTNARGKWTPNYDGAYVVKKAFSGGALILATMDGEEFARPTSVDVVKKYFAERIKEQLAKLKTRKGGLGKKDRLGGLKTRKGGPGKS